MSCGRFRYRRDVMSDALIIAFMLLGLSFVGLLAVDLVLRWRRRR
jgi:hypothetical protein